VYFFVETLERLHNLCYNGIISKKERTKKMNKIYNNLSIENLIKTEWFNQFNSDQKKQILLGIEENVDVLQYAKPDLHYREMEEIRFKLNRKKLDKDDFFKK